MGRSYKEILQAVGCSRRDRSEAKKTVVDRDITAGLVQSMTDTDVQTLFLDARKRVSDEYESPDVAAVFGSITENHRANRSAGSFAASKAATTGSCSHE